MCISICCVRFSFVSTKPRDWLEECLQNDLFWDAIPYLRQSVTFGEIIHSGVTPVKKAEQKLSLYEVMAFGQ